MKQTYKTLKTLANTVLLKVFGCKKSIKFVSKMYVNVPGAIFSI